MAYKDYNQEAETQESQLSRINSAGLTNITLENLWRDCYSAIAQGDLEKWNRKLDAIWIVLGGDVKEGDNDDKAMKDIDLNIYANGSLNNKRIGFTKSSKNSSLIIATQYIWLKKKSLFLKRLQNRQGKGTAYASEDDDDID